MTVNVLINTFSPVHTCIFVEHRQHSEYECTKCSSKVSSPIVSHSKVCGRYLYTEENTWCNKKQRRKITKYETELGSDPQLNKKNKDMQTT